MGLSKVHQELLETTSDGKYANGYIVPPGEERLFHIMFVDIVRQKGGRTIDRAVFQKYFPKEWGVIKGVIENKEWGGIQATGHQEYAVMHDPVAWAAGQKKKADQAAKIRAGAVTKAKKAKAEPEAEEVKQN